MKGRAKMKAAEVTVIQILNLSDHLAFQAFCGGNPNLPNLVGCTLNI